VLLLSAEVSAVSLVRALVELDLIKDVDETKGFAKELSDWIDENWIVIRSNIDKGILQVGNLRSSYSSILNIITEIFQLVKN
jgi:hypothetical protein